MEISRPKLKVAILGSGNIGSDLLVKTSRSPHLTCSLMVGRNLASPGMVRARAMGVAVSDRAIAAALSEVEPPDLIFDATSAGAHLENWAFLERFGRPVIDLTPSRIGTMCVPAINLDDATNRANVNMVTCGGQASIPLAHIIGRVHPDVSYIEVVSSIASQSAGLATRANIDEYVETTERAVQAFSGAPRAKAILILNPALPCIDMQTTVFAAVSRPRLEELTAAVEEMVRSIQSYVPDYKLVVPPLYENGRIAMTVRVRGKGDFLPKYAGNLDIINCAAVAVAEEHAHA
ncbi:MAG TPA: acetaldehyde dehydrogenase (acetylating) [Thermoanaerobaculia bacterium]|nr:acetaldehyde dehydrogenase (acetylating) [Thermoanaerobaculia bacterium]